MIVAPDALTVIVDLSSTPNRCSSSRKVLRREAAKSLSAILCATAPLTTATEDAALQALTDWTSSWSPRQANTYVAIRDQRREQLCEDLAAAKITDTDRSRIEFTVDYLRGDVSRTDLLDTPVLVDDATAKSDNSAAPPATAPTNG